MVQALRGRSGGGMLDTCAHATLDDAARAKGRRTLRQLGAAADLLATDVVEAILDGWRPDESAIKLTLSAAACAEQRVGFGLASPPELMPPTQEGR
jgi:hypothetical protein